MRVDIPSYKVNEGDVISLSEKSKKVEGFVLNFISIASPVNFIEKDVDNFIILAIKLIIFLKSF